MQHNLEDYVCVCIIVVNFILGLTLVCRNFMVESTIQKCFILKSLFWINSKISKKIKQIIYI